MAKNERFEKVYSQGTMNVMEILSPKDTSTFLIISDIFFRWVYVYGIGCKPDVFVSTAE